MRSPATALHPSNLLTGVSLAAGLGSIFGALDGNASMAGALLALAALSDTFDGRFARLFARSRELQALGAQVDSLTDAVAFGVAPVVTMSILIGARGGDAPWIVWWAACVGYTACALMRLAFFNVSDDRDGFVGLPTPVAGLIWSSALAFAPGAWSATALAALLSVAMIAPFGIPRPGRAGLTLFAAWPVVLLVVHLK
jgi:CDP-diacylglycerol---serine O-phosphatidyltransferase